MNPPLADRVTVFGRYGRPARRLGRPRYSQPTGRIFKRWTGI